ncbi:hypothetical protein VRU48_08050 [Pedobacter sp. KR3-3]|uniref:Uncharacterized protein n=1 Tax=Pedobacter albus TaxID=3113905 RepID=A0ABU7I6F8_9SPHI|nr:hypothetical protein [Pedobacter sp. KR3-3]MEE1945055.1 hypothetical protein [Pedobacter sp. KR3-3]
MAIEERESTYKLLSGLIGLKFHSQLKDSGIEFESLYRMTNLATGKENHLLAINGKDIKFVTPRDFVLHFSRYLTSNIEALDTEYNRLINIQVDEFVDEVTLEMRCKEVDYYRIKQRELLEKMIHFKSEL